jgi:hypothetical protein
MNLPTSTSTGVAVEIAAIPEAAAACEGLTQRAIREGGRDAWGGILDDLPLPDVIVGGAE